MVPKPGVKSSEFWLTLVTTVAGALGITVPAAAGTSIPSQVVPVAVALVGLLVTYVGGRAHVKATAIKAGAAQVVSDINAVYGVSGVPKSGSQVVSP